MKRTDIEVDLGLFEHFLERLGTLLTRHAGVSSVSTSNYGPDPERGFQAGLLGVEVAFDDLSGVEVLELIPAVIDIKCAGNQLRADLLEVLLGDPLSRQSFR